MQFEFKFIFIWVSTYIKWRVQMQDMIDRYECLNFKKYDSKNTLPFIPLKAFLFDSNTPISSFLHFPESVLVCCPSCLSDLNWCKKFTFHGHINLRNSRKSGIQWLRQMPHPVREVEKEEKWRSFRVGQQWAAAVTCFIRATEMLTKDYFRIRFRKSQEG